MNKIALVETELWFPDNVAIIGNSGNLLKKDYGEEIDTYKEVIRFNRAVKEGFEKHVGSKETGRCVNNNVFDGSPLSEKEWGKQDRWFIKENVRDQKILYIGPDINPWFKRKMLTHPSCSLYRFKYEQIDALKHAMGLRNEKNPTVGFVMTALCVLSGIKPHLYGFDVGEEIKRTHYFNKRPNPSNVHSLDDEKLALTTLEHYDKIVIHR